MSSSIIKFEQICDIEHVFFFFFIQTSIEDCVKTLHRGIYSTNQKLLHKLLMSLPAEVHLSLTDNSVYVES